MRIKITKKTLVFIILGALALKAVGRVNSAVADRAFKPKPASGRLGLSNSMNGIGAQTPALTPEQARVRSATI